MDLCQVSFSLRPIDVFLVVVMFSGVLTPSPLVSVSDIFVSHVRFVVARHGIEFVVYYMRDALVCPLICTWIGLYPGFILFPS